MLQGKEEKLREKKKKTFFHNHASLRIHIIKGRD